jgi:inward rectifier potassium channel
LGAFYIIVNAAFAVGYLACGRAALVGPTIYGFTHPTDDFLRAFFFSIETFSTVGYGNIAPLGLAANILVTA